MTTKDSPRHLFLSTLGTNAYAPVPYLASTSDPKGTPTSAPQKFIQVARLAALRERLGDVPLHVATLITPDARKTNWDSGGRAQPGGDPQYGGESRWVGLEETLEREGLAAQIHHEDVPIPNGESTGEFWQIFQTITDLVHEGDHLYVDVTHGFRTLQLVLLWSLDYVRRVKRAHIEEITYGAFEVLSRDDGSPRQTWDFRPFLEIQEWTDAYTQIRDRGDFQPFGELATRFLEEKEDQAVRRAAQALPASTTRNDKRTLLASAREDVQLAWAAPQTRPALQAIAKLGEHLELVHMQAIPHAAADACEKLVATDGATPTEPAYALLKIVLQGVAKQVRAMGGPVELTIARVRGQVEAARGLCAHGRWMQGLTVYRELAVDLVELTLPLNHGLERRALDVLMSALPHRLAGAFVRTAGWEAAQVECLELAASNSAAEAISRLVDAIGEPRNAVDHAQTHGKVSQKTLEKAAGTALDSATRALELLEASPARPEFSQHGAAPCSLFNISNHRLTDAQVAHARATLRVESVVNMPQELRERWSAVPTDREAASTAAQAVAAWLSATTTPQNPVLVLGEHGATFELVTRLLARGHRVVHTTTERRATERQLPDGSVVTEHHFQHVGFRDYRA